VTSKRNIKLWAENENEKKVSKTSSFNIEDKYTHTELVIPVFLHEKNLTTNVQYYVVAEGLGHKERAKITLGEENHNEKQQQNQSQDQETSLNENNSKTKIEIIQAPDKVVVGEEFGIDVRISTGNQTVSGNLYAYVHEGKKLISQGKNSDQWTQSWTANKKQIKQDPHQDQNYYLKLRIADKTESKTYTLKARLKTQSSNIDDQRPIKITIKKPTQPTDSPYEINPDNKTEIIQKNPQQINNNLPKTAKKIMEKKQAKTSKNTINKTKEITAITGKTASQQPNPIANPKRYIPTMLLVSILLISIAILSLIWIFIPTSNSAQNDATGRTQRSSTDDRRKQTQRGVGKT